MTKIPMVPMVNPRVVANRSRRTGSAFTSFTLSRELDFSQIALCPTKTPKKMNAWKPISFR